MNRALRLASAALVVATAGLTAAQSPTTTSQVLTQPSGPTTPAPGGPATPTPTTPGPTTPAPSIPGAAQTIPAGRSTWMSQDGSVVDFTVDSTTGTLTGTFTPGFPCGADHGTRQRCETHRRHRERECRRLDAEPARMPLGRNVGRTLPGSRRARAAHHSLDPGPSGESAGSGLDAHRVRRVRPAAGVVTGGRPHLAAARARAEALLRPLPPCVAPGTPGPRQAHRIVNLTRSFRGPPGVLTST